jgi:hypothetical protein
MSSSTTNDNTEKNDRNQNHQDKKNSKRIESIATNLTNAGDSTRHITDTADVARASIAKSIREEGGLQNGKTALDIIEGKIDDNDQSVIQGVTYGNNLTTEQHAGKLDDANLTKDENTSKLVSSGTSLDKSKGIDKRGIYSEAEAGTRHLEKTSNNSEMENSVN